MLQLQLLRLGHAVTAVGDGTHGLRLCLQTPFDVVIGDCNMPGMDGCRLARALRLHESRKQLLPSLILGITARRRKVDAQRCFAATMDRCLLKPLSMAQLKSLLPCSHAQVPGATGLEMIELERLASGESKVLMGLLQVLIETNRNDLKLVLRYARQGDLHGLSMLAHRIKGAVRMIKAQALMDVCQLLEDQCAALHPTVSEVAGSVRLLRLQARRLEIVLLRYRAYYNRE